MSTVQAALVSFILLLIVTHGLKRGPYKLHAKKFDKCPDQGTGEIKFHTNMQKISNTKYVYNGLWTWPYDQDNRFGAKVEIARKVKSGWKKKEFEHKMNNFCKEFKSVAPAVFKKTRDSINAHYNCPLEAGNYTAKGWIMEFKLEVPFLPYGEYRIDLTWLRDHTICLGCLRLYVDVLEKPLFG